MITVVGKQWDTGPGHIHWLYHSTQSGGSQTRSSPGSVPDEESQADLHCSQGNQRASGHTSQRSKNWRSLSCTR